MIRSYSPPTQFSSSRNRNRFPKCSAAPVATMPVYDRAKSFWVTASGLVLTGPAVVVQVMSTTDSGRPT